MTYILTSNQAVISAIQLYNAGLITYSELANKISAQRRAIK